MPNNNPTWEQIKALWEKVNTPIVPQFGTESHKVADEIDAPSLDRSKLMAQIRGFIAGAHAGSGDVVSSLTSPLNVASTLLSAGAGQAAQKGYMGISKGARAIDAAMQVPYVAEGVSNIAKGNVGAGVLETAGGLAGLHGATTRAFDPQAVAETYIKETGRTHLPREPFNPERAKVIGKQYEEMAHTPNEPATATAYKALQDETSKQFHFLKDRAGVKLGPDMSVSKGDINYPDSASMIKDVKKNNRLTFFPTEVGFGTDTMHANHPMLEIDPKTGLTYNDEFRAIHDYFGHAAEGNTFKQTGEHSAFQAHKDTMPVEAHPALRTETEGQNSWLHSGPHVPENASDAMKPYAEQKAGLLPPNLTRAEFATRLQKDPSLAERLMSETGEVKIPGTMGKAAQDIVDRRTQPFGRPPVGVTDRRMGEIAGGVTNPTAKVPVSDTRFKELLGKFGMEAPPEEVMMALEHRSPISGLTELDPAKHGTNTGMSGAESRRRMEPDYGPRGYLSKTGATNIDANLKKANVYDTEAAPKTVYDLTKDPMGLIAKAQEASKTGTNSVATTLERLVREAGFTKLDDGTGTVISFDRMPLRERLKSEKGELTTNLNPTKLRSLWDRLKSEKGQVTIDAEPFINLLKIVKGEPEFTVNVMRKMEAAIKAGEGSAKNWTPLNKHVEAFGGDELGPHTYSRMWGSTSPNTSVGRNNYESIQAFKAMLEGDVPFTKASARQKDITMVGAKVPNLNRAVVNEPLQSGRGSVGKTEAMSRLISGAKDTHANPAIPIDVHALSGLGAGEEGIGQILPQLRKFLDEKQGKQPRSITDLYNTAADIYRKGMDKFGKDVFPTMWEGIKVIKGQGQSQGLTNWLKEKGLLEPGQMVNTKALEAVIQNIDRSDFYGRGKRPK